MQLLLVIFGFVTATAAVAVESFPGHAPDRRILETQEKVDSLFDQGKYDRAMFIYRHELAPLGDKYAQYMVGYMYLSGKGVAEDVVTASAWYRLAAERGQDTYIFERDKLMSLLSAAQRAQSDKVYFALRNALGDVALIAGLIETDLHSLSGRNTANAFSQVSAGPGASSGRDSMSQRTADRIRSRMRYLERKLSVDVTVTAGERRRFAELKARARRGMSELETRR